jgi:hypothetical protein
VVPAFGRRRRWVDGLALLIYLGAAVWVTGRGWVDVHGRLLGSRPNDQAFNEWMLSYGAHATTRLENPFFTTLQNAPDGINLMSNVGMQLIGILLTPMTLIAGAPFSYLFLITGNLAGTAAAWYWVLARHLSLSRPAAFIGGACCAFLPALVSHSNGHPHITAQWLVPFIVWRVLVLTRPQTRPVRDGLILSGFIVAQFFIGLEILFLTAFGLAVAALAYLVVRPREAAGVLRPVLTGLGVTAVTVAVVTAYPLWMQFAGPQHRIGHPGTADQYALSFGALVGYATESLAGGPTSARSTAPNTTEEAAFFGWSLLVLLVVIVIWLRREPVVRILAGTGVLTALLADGTRLSWHRADPGVPGPYALLDGLPIVDAMVVSRFALITTVTVALLLAIAAERIVRSPAVAAERLPVRLIAGGALVAALLPLAPTPLPAGGRAPIPTFITDGGWRKYVGPGRTLVPVPVDNMRSVHWSVAGRLGFAVPQGYFLGPVSATDDTGRWGVEPRPTSALLVAVARGERDPDTITEADRIAALADVRHWKADALVLGEYPRAAELRRTLDALYGPGQPVADVWLWDVRALTNG